MDCFLRLKLVGGRPVISTVRYGNQMWMMARRSQRV